MLILLNIFILCYSISFCSLPTQSNKSYSNVLQKYKFQPGNENEYYIPRPGSPRNEGFIAGKIRSIKRGQRKNWFTWSEAINLQ